MDRDDRDKTKEQLLDECEVLRTQNAALRERNSHLEAALGIIPDAVSPKDTQGRHLIVEAETPLAFEEEATPASGRKSYYTVKFPLRNVGNEIESVGGISIDVTDRRRAEDALAESRSHFQAIFENNLDAIVLLDEAFQFVDANPVMCEQLGYSRDEHFSDGKGLGLLGMHERAALIGGRVAGRSVPGRGTEVRLTIPLRQAPERG
jgi:PAS domain-containing protein